MKTDKNGNQDCKNVINCLNCVCCHNSTECNNSTLCNNNTLCNNSTLCDNSTLCNNSTGCDNSTMCNNSTLCHNSTKCDNSTWCRNSTKCDNSAYLLFCNGLVLEKYRIFNKKVTPKEWDRTWVMVCGFLGLTHPNQLTKEQIVWLKKNVKQFDAKVLKKVVDNSILPDKPKEAGLK